MIKLDVKKKYFFYFFIRGIITAACALPMAIYGLIVLFTTILDSSPQINFDWFTLLWCSLPVMVVNLCFVFIGPFYKRRLNNLLDYEFYQIITYTKIKNNPKVVYVYTCHNDMYKSRVLQNARQTYKNMEVWISEGSENVDVINQSRDFALKNNFHFFAVGGKGSENKADNLNSFLKNANVTFDYLLITDSDEVLHPRFVENALKCFLWKDFHNLGYVSARNYCYDTKSLFSNVFQNIDTSTFKNHIDRNYTFGEMPNLYSASCLVSKTLLDTNNKMFPSGCLEDVYLEHIAICNSFSSLILPLSICGQAYDVSIKAFHKRTLRILDWCVKLVKERRAQKLNEKYSSWWRQYFSIVFLPVIYLVKIVSLSIVIWLLIYFNQYILSNCFICTTFFYGVGVYIISKILSTFVTARIHKIGNRLWPLALLLQPLFTAALAPYQIKHWFQSIVLSKYSAFGGSGQKTKKKSVIGPIKWDILLFLLWSLFIVGLTLLFALYIKFDDALISLIYVIFVGLFIYFWICSFSELVLYFMGLINYHPNYSKDDFITLPKNYESAKNKNNFIKNNKNNPLCDLSCLD